MKNFMDENFLLQTETWIQYLINAESCFQLQMSPVV